MPLQPINLDDRRFEELVESALIRARQQAPEWTDLSHGDPGRVLLELFSHLTEVMIYRINRLPLKVYVECLRLLGMQRYAAAAAVTTLQFSLEKAVDHDIKLPRGTRIGAARAAAGSEAAVFSTSEPITIAAGATYAEVLAHHCDWVEAELLGHGSGSGGQHFRVARGAMIAPTGDSLDLVVGVEIHEGEATDQAPLREHEGKTFRLWRAIDHFGESRDRHVYIADRQDGTVTFGPALHADRPEEAVAHVPAIGREIRAWYRTGGGPDGNLAADTLTQLLDPVPNVTLTVTNPQPAVGGRESERVEEAWARGPRELHSLNRAITAEDFRLLALKSGGAINRAYAYNKYEQWRYATRGTVEVICMPHVPIEQAADGPITPAMVKANQSDEVLQQVSDAIAAKRPLGTHCLARWGRLKTVSVKARVVIFREEDAQAVRRRVVARLHDLINPLERGDQQPGWRFGQPISTYDVYRILNSEPGVKYVDPVRLCLDEVPAKDVTALCADAFQPLTWYAASGDGVFRSLNDGDGWEQIARIEGGRVRQLMAYPREAAGAASRAGLIAAITEFDAGKSRVHLSRDCGESWEEIGARPQFPIDGMAWKDNADGEPALLLAAEKGLYELAIEPGAEPVAILVDDQHADLGFWGVAVSTDVWGQTCVAVAARNRGGVYLSTDSGRPGTFEHIGLKDEKVREIAVQHDGPNRHLWIGMEAVGDDPGEGCARWQLPQSPKGWERYGNGWKAGGCLGLSFAGAHVLAGTRRHGVLRLDPGAKKPTWSKPDVQCGLPMQSLERMEAVDFVAAGDASSHTIMTAGSAGIHRRRGEAVFEHCSQVEFTDRVTLPATWLFCSGHHDIEVTEDAADRD